MTMTLRGKAVHWTIDTIEAAFVAFFAAYHRAPRQTEWTAATGLPSRKTVARVWGPLADLYRRLGIPTLRPSRRKARWTPARIQEALQAFQHRTGRWPMTDDFCPAEGLPHRVTVHRLVGTLAEARRQAGMGGGGAEGHGGSGRGGGAGNG